MKHNPKSIVNTNFIINNNVTYSKLGYDNAQIILGRSTGPSFDYDLLAIAEKIVNNDPYMIKIQDELYHLETLLKAKRDEVDSYRKDMLDKAYKKAVNNKAFL